VEEGTERKIVHKPNYTKDRGDLVCVYAVFKTKDGNVDFEVMSIDEVDAIRMRSKASSSGPWVTDYEEMAKKTVMRRLLKRAPMSIELASAVAFDNNAAVGEFDKSGDIIDLGDIDISDAETSAEIQSRVNADRTAELREQLKAKSAPAPAPEEEVNPYADYTQLIGQALKETGAPLEMKEVIAYMTANNMAVGVDTDFRAIVNEAANKLL
jgi:recombination protein RecT